jgi:hypothetical protein
MQTLLGFSPIIWLPFTIAAIVTMLLYLLFQRKSWWPAGVLTVLLGGLCGMVTSIVLAVLDYASVLPTPGIQIRAVHYGWDIVGLGVGAGVGSMLAFYCLRPTRRS